MTKKTIKMVIDTPEVREKIRKKLVDIAVNDLHFQGVIYLDDVLSYLLVNCNKITKIN